MSIQGLEIRLAFIKQRMTEIRAEGAIAPPKTWIHRYYVPKKGKKYWYYRLMVATDRKSKTGSIQGKVQQYLGNAKSGKYKEMRAAIERRNELQVLQRRYDRLLAEYQKALSSELVSKGNFSETETEITANNSVAIVARLINYCESLEQKQEQLSAVVRAMATELGLTEIVTPANTG